MNHIEKEIKMKSFSAVVLLFFSLSPLTSLAGVDQYSDMNGGIDLHVDNITQYVFDTKDISSGDVTSEDNSTFTINKSGLYRINYTINWKTNDLNRRQVKTYVTKNSLDILNGSYAYGYARREDEAGNATNSASFYAELSSNDSLKLMYKKESSVIGQAYSIPSESIISFELIKETTVTPKLETSGQYGNIALVGKNGLSALNYTASSTYSADSAAGAFDGYNYYGLINGDTSGKVNRGIWLSSSGLNTNQWLQVNFNKVVNVSGFRVVINSTVSPWGRLPKEVIVQTSNDGVNFTNHELFTLQNVLDQVMTLTSPTQTQYFRLFIKNNYGDQFIQIDELEVIQ